MAFKVSNETKVGALTAITITLLILGFNFLKGNNPLKSSRYLFAKFASIDGLVPANPIFCNGLVIGSVYDISPADVLLDSILVTIRLTENVQLPKDSYASIKASLIGTPTVEIAKGSSTFYLQKGDTIQTRTAGGFLGAIMGELGPTQAKLNSALGGLDTLLGNTNRMLDKQTQVNLQHTIASLSEIASNLTKTTRAINELLASQNNKLTNTIANLESTSHHLNEGTQKLPEISANLEKVTRQLSEAELKKLVSDLDGTILALKSTMDKLNSADNSVGALMNDRKLYDNLTSTINSMNLLMQDLRLHPKRYVNVSVFGKKDKSDPLMKPMKEDSVTQEQIREK